VVFEIAGIQLPVQQMGWVDAKRLSPRPLTHARMVVAHGHCGTELSKLSYTYTQTQGNRLHRLPWGGGAGVTIVPVPAGGPRHASQSIILRTIWIQPNTDSCPKYDNIKICNYVELQTWSISPQRVHAVRICPPPPSVAGFSRAENRPAPNRCAVSLIIGKS
jgi:hypothetical protein